VAEILYGVERLPNGRRKDMLREAAVDVFSTFTEDVLPFDAAAATVYPGDCRSSRSSGDADQRIRRSDRCDLRRQGHILGDEK